MKPWAPDEVEARQLPFADLRESRSRNWMFESSASSASRREMAMCSGFMSMPMN